MDNAVTYYERNDAFTRYEEEYQRLGFFERTDKPVAHFFRGTRLEMNQEKGQGWAEILQIDNGLHVGLCSYRLKKCVEFIHYSMITPIQFNILISGRFDVQLAGEPRQMIGPGDIWFSHGHQQQMVYSQPHNASVCGLSIGLPAPLVENWLGNDHGEATRELERLVCGKSPARNAGPHTIFPLMRGMHQSTDLMRTAKKLLTAEHQTIFGKLHFESLALELLAQLLTLEKRQGVSSIAMRRGNNAIVDTAVDILREEWMAPPTISSLAKRVGTNECYLKKGFREQTGMSIGEYIRHLRMGKAQELLETGRHTVTEVAFAVGYTNPSHFSAAFKKFYGETPSRYLSRAA